MATSANVVKYTILKDGIEVGNHRQHMLCKSRWDELCTFMPIDKYTIIEHGLDENEASWQNDEVPLNKFLLRIASSSINKIQYDGAAFYWKNEWNGKVSQKYVNQNDAIVAYHCKHLVWDDNK